ncbi:MAG: LLM class flavin-dependent oxidoreductase [Actinobacteria bacterium]|nr:LLM class flavin-dependent oxidoreductase [Actinomycetota bacterium]
MEFGIFIQHPVFAHHREGNPGYEHQVIMQEIALVEAADRAGFKYVWITEHHFLDEYSHLSANDVMAGYFAHSTERIHIGSGIFNPLPQVNHPAKVAERVATLDHLTNRRFEFGTGRGAGSHEILGFLAKDGVTDTSTTKEIWEETIPEFAKMWLQDTYEGFDGKWWTLPPRKILPKCYGSGHPAMWYAAGNTSSYEMAARKGLGVLGFSVGQISELEPVLKAYKQAVIDAEPVGAFVNDNLMVTATAFLAEDGGVAFQRALDSEMTYLQSNVFRYHDTFPHPEGVPYWPELIPPNTPEALQYQIDGGLIVGDPDQAVEQCRRWESAGADQLVFGVSMATFEQDLETIRLMGEHVIPKIDTDPIHRTTRFRDALDG